MIRLNAIWKLYLTYTVVLIVCMALGGFIIEGKLRDRLKGQLKGDMTVLAQVIARAVPETEDPARLHAFCREYQKTAGVRVTLIGEDGRVVGESERDAAPGDNHLQRPEVRDALRSGAGTAIRKSSTLGVDMLYVALALEGRNKVLRLAVTLKKVTQIQNEVMIFLSLAVYFIPVLTIGISFFLARFIQGEDSRADRVN